MSIEPCQPYAEMGAHVPNPTPRSAASARGGATTSMTRSTTSPAKIST